MDSRPDKDEKKDEQEISEKGADSRSYNGPIRFMNLAESLRSPADLEIPVATSHNVLFAAGSLKSAAILLPIACQMGAELRSYVHFALMSRSEMEMDELRQVNGVDDSCHIKFHGMAGVFCDWRLNQG